MTAGALNTWIELGVKGTIVLVAAVLACRVLRDASAASRHLVWTTAVTALLALPVLSALTPAVTVPISTLASEAAVLPSSLALLQGSASNAAEHSTPAERTRRSAGAQVTASSAHSAWPRWGGASETPMGGSASALLAHIAPGALLVGVWIVGVLMLLARLLTAMLGVRRLVRRATPVEDDRWHEALESAAADMHVGVLPDLGMSTALSVPMTGGVMRPAILLPASAARWDPSRMRIVLLHELAHVRRRDCLVHCLGQAALALHWCNPLAWIALARLRAERERACDDLVLVTGTEGADYAEHLLDIARQFRGADRTLAAVAMARPTELEGRLLAILDPLRSRRPADRVRIAGGLALAAMIVLPVSALRLQAGVALPEPAERMAAQAPTPTPTPAPSPAPVPAPVEGVREGVRGGVRGGVSGGAGKAAPAIAGRDDQESAIPEATRTQVAQALMAALKDENAEVREQAMHALAQMRSPAAFEPIVAALKDASPEVRNQAAFSLGELGDARAIGPLTAVMKDTDAEVRGHAVFALGQLRAKEAVPALAGALADENAEVRQQAAFALGQIEDPSAVQPLTAALKDANAEVRGHAAFALGQIGDRASVGALVQLLKDGTADVRGQAAFALSQVGDASAVDALTAVMTKDPDPEVRQQAAFALGQVLGRGGHRRDKK